MPRKPIRKPIGRFVNQPSKELEAKQGLVGFQLFALLSLIVSLFVVYMVEIISPDFFNYPYFTFSVSVDNLIKFWPLFLYAGFMALLSSYEIVSTRLDGQILRWDMATSILAGIWEELGFRWLYICSSMIVIIIMNWVFSTFLGWLFGLAIIAGGILMVFLVPKKLIYGLSGAMLVVSGYLLIQASSQIDPIFWFYENLTLPLINFVTFGRFENIFYGGEYSKLFLYGMISANTKFRDGHKYQGFYGYVNSWIVGFILMGAMLNYGLATAILIHAIYDIEFDLIRYASRKVRRIQTETAR